MRSQLLYANLVTQLPSLSVAGDTYAFPVLTVGKQYSFSTRFLDSVNAQLRESFPKIRALRANVGFDDLRPTSHTTKLQIGSGASVPGANTTAAINFDETGDALKNKLNALTDITPHDFSVQTDSGSYFIRRASGAQFAVSVIENRFKPVSFVRIRQWQDDEGWMTELRFIQSPLAFTDTAAPVLPPKPYFEPVADGVDYGNDLKQNEVQNLVIPRTFRGQFFVWYKKTPESSPVRTQLFSRSDGPTQYQAGVNAVLAADGGSVTVTNPDPGKARFEFGGDLAGVDIPLLTVEVPVDGAPPGDWTFILDLNTIEAWRAVIASKDPIAVPFILEADVPLDDEDEESPSKTIPIWDFNLTLKRPLTWEGLATAQPVNWLRKPNPKTYLPYNQTQVGVGQFYYSPEELLGDGSETHFEIPHNLGVPALTGLCVIDVTDGRILKESEYEAHNTNDGNTLELDFAEPPAASSILVALAAPQPLEFFINDLLIEIAQVDGLPGIISDITSRLEAVEAILPSTGPGVTTESTAPILFEIPEKKEVLFYSGSESLFDAEKGLDVSKLPTNRRPPFLLPAIHSESEALIAWPDPEPDPEETAGTIFLNAGEEEIDLAGESGIPSAVIPPGGFIGSDARMLYALSRMGVTNSYYPAAFERELFILPVNSEMFIPGRKFLFEFSLRLQLALASGCRTAAWGLLLDLGTLPAEAEPDPVSINLGAVVWSDPFIRQRIPISEVPILNNFGVSISRGTAEIGMDKCVYGNWLGADAAAPASANYVLRGRLAQFDTENGAPLARAWPAYQLLPGLKADGSFAEKLQASISA